MDPWPATQVMHNLCAVKAGHSIWIEQDASIQMHRGPNRTQQSHMAQLS